MRIEYALIAAIVIYAIVTFTRHSTQSEEDKAKQSWAVRAWNAAGGPQVESARLLPATAELVGRGVGTVARKIKGTAKAKTAEVKARSADRVAEQRERAAELTDQARAAAVARGRAVVEAVERRWGQRGGDRPFIDRQPTDDAPAPVEGPAAGEPETVPAPRWRRLRRFVWWRRNSPSSEPSSKPESGDDDGDSPIAGQADCPRCGAVVKGVIPASEQDFSAKCACGFRVRFFRAPNDPPEPTTPDLTQPATDSTSTPQEDTVTATTETTTVPVIQPTAILAPNDWRLTAARVANFEPESDADLVNFMSAEIAGMCGYAEGYEALFETCTRSLGLDQRSVQGLGEFGEQVVEVTKQMAMAHKRFVVIYQEVMKMVADGTVMPHNGRFFSGDVAV